jgi:hypothetical protein
VSAASGAWSLEQTLKALAPGEEVLAVWEGGALLSMPHPEVPNADQAKLLDVRMVGERTLRLTPGLPLEDAARVWQGRLLAISVDHELLELDEAGQVKRVIEGPVQGPLSVSADGRLVAYMRGEAPELGPVVLDVATGVAREIAAQGFAWAPALSEDGRMVSFVEGGERGPKLVRVSVDGGMREVLEARGHFPVGTRAPLWMGEVLVFEAEAGLMAWSPRGVWPLSGMMPVRVPGDQARVLVHRKGGSPSLIVLDARE